jgi:hypothetical protein
VTWGGRGAQALVQLTLANYGLICHLCRKPGATTADHLIPRSHGGTDDLENLRPAHGLCNSRRGDRSIAWFRARYCPELLDGAGHDGRDFFKTNALEAPRHACPFSPHPKQFSGDDLPIVPMEITGFFTPDEAQS